MKKIIYIILDGLADAPIKELKNKTPLESAVTVSMDRLAREGITGLVYPVERGVAPESDLALLSLLSYDPSVSYTGRGPLEAYAAGITMSEGNIALRVNFAAIAKDGKTIIDRRAGRDISHEEACALAKEINSKVSLTSATFEFQHTVGYRGVLVIKGMHTKLSGYITNTDPAYERKGLWGIARPDFPMSVQTVVPLSGYENFYEAREAAALINEFTVKCSRVLEKSPVNKKREEANKLPVNMVLCRDAGDRLPKLVSLREKTGVAFCAFVQMPIEKGIARLAGMDLIEFPSSMGHLDVDYPIWAKVARDAMKRYDGVYIHLKGLDEPAHDGDFRKKKEILEMIDKFFFAHLISELDIKNTIICVTSDHATLCKLKAHSSDPVPVLISGGSVKPDGSTCFSERAARDGSLKIIKSRDIIPLLLKLAGK